MVDPLLDRYADLLVGYCIEAAAGEHVLLSLDTPATDMARALVRAVLQAGAEPHLRLAYPEYTADFVSLAGDAVLASPASLQLEEMRRMDAYVRVAASANSRGMNGVDPARLARLQHRDRATQEERVNHTRWVSTLFPTPAAAQDAGMSTDDYERFVFDAMFLFDPEPAARWRELRDHQARIIERLSGARQVRILAEGTDLRLDVGGRTWVNSDGKRNMPSGEVFTGPHEASAEGAITFDVPCTVRGEEVQNVRLTFEGGEVVEARAERGQEVLDAQLATDAGARRLGELGIGTNQRIQRPSRSVLFDEKIGGTVHLALGRSYPETGGVNESAIHWDLVCDLRRGGSIQLDGEPFQEDGGFLL
ncbi:MAG TPA: aminopeptidase [Trueperaceae bacterium]|nr:aminopeptidase [Trueperaceae bacterium]